MTKRVEMSFKSGIRVRLIPSIGEIERLVCLALPGVSVTREYENSSQIQVHSLIGKMLVDLPEVGLTASDVARDIAAAYRSFCEAE